MKDQTKRPAAYWKRQADKPTCSEPGCTRPARIWTRRRSFCTACVPPSALVLAYEQIWDMVTSPTTLILDTTNVHWQNAENVCAAAAGHPVIVQPAATPGPEPAGQTGRDGQGA